MMREFFNAMNSDVPKLILQCQLKHVEALHIYLRRNNLAKFIPKSGQLLEDKPLRRRPVVKKDTVVAEVETPTKGTGRTRRIRKNR